MEEPQVGQTWRCKEFPGTRICVTEIKANGAVLGDYLGPIPSDGPFACPMVRFLELWERDETWRTR